MCYLRGACRSGDSGQSGVDKDGTVAKHEKQQKVRGSILIRLHKICDFQIMCREVRDEPEGLQPWKIWPDNL